MKLDAIADAQADKPARAEAVRRTVRQTFARYKYAKLGSAVIYKDTIEALRSLPYGDILTPEGWQIRDANIIGRSILNGLIDLIDLDSVPDRPA